MTRKNDPIKTKLTLDAASASLLPQTYYEY